jgi:LPXTG-site transpeptidase (sortase) family protein
MTLVDDDVLIQSTELPRAPVVETVRRRRSIRPLIIASASVIVALVAVLWIFEVIVGPLMYAQRQQHLSASYSARIPEIHESGAAMALQIPDLDSSTIVIEGVSLDNLRGGPAHLADSGLPGDPGVMVIYGHRHAYGAPFAKIDRLAKNASIIVKARNGPIVEYRVDRVERNTTLKTVQLGDDTGSLSYLLLVSSENGVFNNKQIVVVARALPISDAAPLVPDLDDGPGRSLPFGIEVLLGNAALAAAVLAWLFLRRRTSAMVRVAAVAPMAVFGVVRIVLMLDSLRPITR